jgi:hypothetical protein
LNEPDDELLEHYEQIASAHDAFDEEFAEIEEKHNIKILFDSDFYEELVDDENLENFLEIVKNLAGTSYEDVFDMYGGDIGEVGLSLLPYALFFDPQTGDVDVTLRGKVHDDEYFDQMKNAKTIFGGFRFPEKETIFAFNAIDFIDADELEFETEFFKGVLGQVLDAERELFKKYDPNFDEEYWSVMSEDWLEFYGTIFVQERSDVAAVLSSDGIFLAGATVSDTDQLKNSFANTLKFLRKEDATGSWKLMQKRWKKNITTVNGFNVSGFSIPCSEFNENVSLPLQDKNLTVYWAVKEDQAVAFAVGFSDKTKDVFIKALQATNEPVAVTDHVTLSLRPLGRLLKNFGVDALAYADSDAQVTLSIKYEENTIKTYITVAGNFIQTVARLIKTYCQ